MPKVSRKLSLEESSDDEQYQDGSDQDEEVFALKDISGDEIDDEDANNEDEDEDSNEEDEEIIKQPKRQKRSQAKTKSSSSEESESEKEETWGRKVSAYYSSNAAQLDSDDDEANELEEQEARRLQANARDSLKEDDFGLNDTVSATLLGTTDASDDFVDENTFMAPTKLQDKKSILRHLERNNPLSLALARDWDDTARSLIKTEQIIRKKTTENHDSSLLGMVHLHYQALSAYAATLAFYLYLRANTKYAQKPELLESHPITSRLLTLKQALQTLEDLDFAASDSEFGDVPEDEDGFEDIENLGPANNQATKVSIVDEPIEPPIPPKKKRKTSAKADKPPEPIFDLVEPVFTSSKQTSSHLPTESSDTYGEVTTLDQTDVDDKKARKKSLRFHTSKINSTSTRRQGARNMLGGDDDIPYRERKKEREIRLTKENTDRGQGGADLDDIAPEPRREESTGEEGDIDGYYDLVQKSSKERKERKKAEYEAAVTSIRAGLISEESVDGPRSLTRAILANKGLTPRRPKSVRNPRVKKRLKFEKAKRKVASQKSVYKGGISATGVYEGEKSGISKVIKSIPLG